MFSLLAKLFSLVLFLLETAVHFLKAVIVLCVAIGLLWGLGLAFPAIAAAWGAPCSKLWDCVTSVTSGASSGVSSVYGTMTAEQPRTPTPPRAPTSTPVPPPPPEAKPASAPAAPAPAPPPPPVVAPAPSEWARTQDELNTVWEKDWPQAIRLLETFLERSPTHPEARGKLNSALISEGDLLLQRGDRGGAVDRYSRAAGLGTPDGTARARLTALTPTPTPVPPPTRTATPVHVQAPAPPPPPPAASKPQSGFLGTAYVRDWCRQVHDGTVFDNIWSFPQSEGFYCVTMRGDRPVDLNDVCRRAYNNPGARGRRSKDPMLQFYVDCSAP